MGDGSRVKRTTPTPARNLQIKKKEPQTISVLFVDQTVGGELARRLQQVEDRLAGVTGYRVRIAETSGSQLCRLLPSTNPWGQGDCSRPDCYTCSQEGENKVNCKERNIIYESACILCNGDRFEKKSKWESFKEMTAVYVGETSRSIFERAGEHWQDVKSGKIESHMWKHWQTDHCTADALLPKVFATPNDDAEKRKEEARESEASRRKDVEKERTHIKSVNEITLVN